MKNLISVLTLIVLFSCQNKKDSYTGIPQEPPALATDPMEGKKLMETHCYLCHSPKASENQGRIAPPMVAIKARYIDKEGYNKAEFIEAVTSFVSNPTEDNALMRGAVRKHGLIPKQAFPKGSVAKIAVFMYDYQIEEPDWFQSHWQSHGNKNWLQTGKIYTETKTTQTYSDIGLEYALATKKVLGKNLMTAIQQKGTIDALEFCNVQAMPLTDSMTVHYNATVKRVSDRNRNPNNKANAEELFYIDHFKNLAANRADIKPVVLEKTTKIQFYYPIETNSMCLQCHGTKLKPEVSKQILKLYPNDLAVGYNENEIRGIWSITFDKK